MSSAFDVLHPEASESGSDVRLDCWKEIAEYLHRSLRSARRWEKNEGLPVHRSVHAEGDSVYAYRRELDNWWTKDASLALPSDARLDSWKEIATYMLRSVRSARRWAKEEGLPVRCHVHKKGKSIYAFRAELDEWSNTPMARESQRVRENTVLAWIS